MTLPLLLLADDGVGFWHKATFGEATQVILVTAAFGLLGIFLLFIAYKIFDWLTPGLHIERELAEKNMAVAAVIVALLLSVGLIVARTVG
jgi:uncharacterized membrane protein YjfL (UPF0719 family)